MVFVFAKGSFTILCPAFLQPFCPFLSTFRCSIFRQIDRNDTRACNATLGSTAQRLPLVHLCEAYASGEDMTPDPLLSVVHSFPLIVCTVWTASVGADCLPVHRLLGPLDFDGTAFTPFPFPFWFRSGLQTKWISMLTHSSFTTTATIRLSPLHMTTLFAIHRHHL